jgi:hypothetical protein
MQTLAVGLRALATIGIYTPETFDAGLALALSRVSSNKPIEGSSGGVVIDANSSINPTSSPGSGRASVSASSSSKTEYDQPTPEPSASTTTTETAPAAASKRRGTPRKGAGAQEAPSDSEAGAQQVGQAYRGPGLEWGDVAALLWAAATVGHGLDADR